MNKETLSTSEKEIPKHNNALEEKYKSEPTKEPLNPENIQEQKSQLPVPSGWRLLVLILWNGMQPMNLLKKMRKNLD